MIAFILWIIGIVLAVKAALEILKLEGDTIKKLLAVIVLVVAMIKTLIKRVKSKTNESQKSLEDSNES